MKNISSICERAKQVGRLLGVRSAGKAHEIICVFCADRQQRECEWAGTKVCENGPVPKCVCELADTNVYV